MKTTFKIMLALLITSGRLPAGEPKFDLKIEDVKTSKTGSMEFSIRLINTGEDELKYSLGQYFMTFDERLLNGGKAKLSIVSSELPQNFRPRSVNVEGNMMKLACNTVSSDKSVLPVIPSNSSGLLIATLRLETTSGTVSNIQPDLKFTGPDNVYLTKLVFYSNNTNIIVPFSGHQENEYDGSELSATENSAPMKFDLAQNYPNPFNPVTMIRFAVPYESNISIKVYDMTGRMIANIANGKYLPGQYEAAFDGSGLASGMYVYRFEAGSFSRTLKMVLLK